MKALALINEKSGAVQRIGADAIRRHVEAAQSTVTDLSVETVAGEHAVLMKALQRKDEFDVVVSAGGDGTQAAVAGALLGSETALLPLPCGTMNMLCHDLGIPQDIEAALRAGLSGEVDAIDAGVIGDRVFLNNVVVGAYAEMAEAREELRDAETLDEVSYGLVAGANALFHAEPMAFHLEIDDAATKLETNTIAISNNAVSGADTLRPYRDRLDEGDLYLYLTKARHGGDFASFLADFAAGSAESSSEISVRQCKRCVVHADGKRFSYSVDGDPLETDAPIHLEIKPRALKIYRPRKAQ
ncbi:MAG: diacylglycerol kinase family protein [Pseudomonadota bacterium]